MAGVQAATATKGATEQVRGARAVHLNWQAPPCDAFYGEVVVENSAQGSYFMVCGWRGGYFGIQERADKTKVAIFSLWDPVAESKDNKGDKNRDRVEVLFHMDGTQIKQFHDGGTGPQCLIDWPWEIGQTNRFLVRSRTEGGKTTYAGFIYDAKKQQWLHLATYRRTEGKTGGLGGGLYSFVEDFHRNGTSATEVRRATFKNVWIETKDSGWQPLRAPLFNAAKPDGRAKDAINGGVNPDGASWFLVTGGDTKQQTALKSPMKLTAPSAPLPKDLPDFPSVSK